MFLFKEVHAPPGGSVLGQAPLPPYPAPPPRRGSGFEGGCYSTHPSKSKTGAEGAAFLQGICFPAITDQSFIHNALCHNCRIVLLSSSQE